MKTVHIRAVFIWEAIFISLTGGFVGLLLGLIFCWLQGEFGLIKLDGSFLEYFPIAVKLSDVFMIYAIILGLGLLASVYPARLAGKLVKS